MGLCVIVALLAGCCLICACAVMLLRRQQLNKPLESKGFDGIEADGVFAGNTNQRYVSDLVPDATSGELVFSSAKFPDRKTSVYSSTEASSTSAYEFSQLDNAERRRRRKASLCAGDECYSGATGTKDAPENPSGFRRTQAHDHPTTTVPPPPRDHGVTTASSPPPRHDHFATTLPPPSRRHTFAATALPPPFRRHTLAATALPPPSRPQSLGSTEPPARESADASRYRCGAEPEPDSCLNSVFYV